MTREVSLSVRNDGGREFYSSDHPYATAIFYVPLLKTSPKKQREGIKPSQNITYSLFLRAISSLIFLTFLYSKKAITPYDTIPHRAILTNTENGT